MVGTGRGCVNDEMSEEVKGEVPNDVLPINKATRDAANAGRQYEFEVTPSQRTQQLNVEKKFKAG
jgi:hypothetical protein